MTRLCSLLFAVAVCACSRSLSTAVSGNPGQVAAGDVVAYTGDVAINPLSQQLSAHWSMSFAADSATTDSVALLLNPGLTVSRVGGQNVAGYASGTRDEDRVLVVRFAPRLLPGAQGRIDIDYAGVPVFGSDGINRIATSMSRARPRLILVAGVRRLSQANRRQGADRSPASLERGRERARHA
jgi:hypothetical protein